LYVANSVKMDTVAPPYYETPSSYKVKLDANPAYEVTGMEDNPSYQTNPGGEGAGNGVDYYEDIINDRNVKMTQNPAYAVP